MAEEKEISTIVKEVEAQYPEMTKEFKRLMREQYDLFCLKTSNYGTDNIALGTSLTKPEDVTISITGIWFRMNDKINRLKQMLLIGKKDNVGESVEDSLTDLSVYGIIARVVRNGKWGK